MPSENPRLNSDERGLIITDFVDRVGDPVGIVAADGSHAPRRGAARRRAARRCSTTSRGAAHRGPVAVTHPGALASGDRRRAAPRAGRDARVVARRALVSDASRPLTALQDDPGVPDRRRDRAVRLRRQRDQHHAGRRRQRLPTASAPTVRHTDLSGDLIDQALLTHVRRRSVRGRVGRRDRHLGDRPADPAARAVPRGQGTAVDHRGHLAGRRAAGHRGEVRLTRTELDDAIRQPLADFAGVLQDTLDRNGVRAGDLVAVASVGGGARIPLITTTLSEHLGVPVITTAQPELTAAIGGGLQAARGTVDDGTSPMAEASPPTAAAAAAVAATQMAPEVHAEGAGSTGARRWPGQRPTTFPMSRRPGPVRLPRLGHDGRDGCGPRPQMQFASRRPTSTRPPSGRSVGLLVGGLILVLAAVAVAVWLVLRNNESTPSPSSTTVTTTPTVPPSETPVAPPPASEAPPPPATRNGNDHSRAGDHHADQEPPPPPPTSEAPPPPPTSEAPPPAPESPSSPSAPPRLVPTLPYETIPGLPFVPRPIQPAQPAP